MSAKREPQVPMQYRAQVKGVNGWVDGGLFVKLADAERDATRLAATYDRPVRVIQDYTGYRK